MLLAYALAGETPLSRSLFWFREERGFEGSPRSCYSREFMPFLNGKGGTLGLCGGSRCGSEGLPFAVGLFGLVYHEEVVVMPLK